MRPDLVGSGPSERRFGSYLEQLVRSGATAFCASDEVGVTLTEHLRQGRHHPAGRASLPDAVAAARDGITLGMTSRIEVAEPFVLYCSTIEVRKNHIMLARIWQQALEEGVKLPKLVCVGYWGWMIEPLRAFLKAHPGLLEQIIFTGPISDEALIGYYRSASFGVFPSHIEGWGYAASECIDFGIPVIVSTTPALIEASGGLMPAMIRRINRLVCGDPQDGAGRCLAFLAGGSHRPAASPDAGAQKAGPPSRQACWRQLSGRFIVPQAA